MAHDGRGLKDPVQDVGLKSKGLREAAVSVRGVEIDRAVPSFPDQVKKRNRISARSPVELCDIGVETVIHALRLEFPLIKTGNALQALFPANRAL